MVLVPRLKFQNRNFRLSWALRHFTKRESFWFQTLFSDEKHFTIDGPYVHNHYWNDLCTNIDRFFKRQKGGGSLMFWSASNLYSVSELVIVNGNIDFENYLQVFQGGLPPFSCKTFREETTWKFSRKMVLVILPFTVAPGLDRMVCLCWIGHRDPQT